MLGLKLGLELNLGLGLGLGLGATRARGVGLGVTRARIGDRVEGMGCVQCMGCMECMRYMQCVGVWGGCVAWGVWCPAIFRHKGGRGLGWGVPAHPGGRLVTCTPRAGYTGRAYDHVFL